MKLGQKYRSKNGQVGKIEDIRGVPRLVVRDNSGKATQTINPKDIDLSEFEETDG